MDNEIKKDLASNWFKLLQNAICDDISKLEKNKIKFKSTTWQRSKIKDEGGGEYRIIKNGKIFEKVGVNFSKVYGKFPKKFQNNDTILFGRESAGVPEKVHKALDNRLKIPMEKNKRSLNLASSVAIILAECLKQTKWI